MINKRVLAVFTFVLLYSVNCSESIKTISTERSEPEKNITSGVIPLDEETYKGQVIPIEEETAVKKIRARGSSSIFGNDIENARRSALRDAYAQAVSRGIGREIGSMSIIRNAKSVNQIVISRSNGYINDYKILSEGIINKKNPIYEVFIEAEVVEKGKVNRSEINGLRLYLELLGNPALLIILPEKKAGVRTVDLKKEEGVLRNMETALAEVILDYGYQVVTSDDLKISNEYGESDLTEARRGVSEKIIEIARYNDIDLVLMGELFTNKEIVKPEGVQMIKTEGRVSAKAIIVSSGKVIDTYQRTARSAHFSETEAYSAFIKKIASQIGDTLAWKIPEILMEEYRETKLILSGLNIDQADEIRLALKEITGVEAVKQLKLPAADDQEASYILMSGFIPLEFAQIRMVCEMALESPIEFTEISKFTIKGRIKLPE